MEQKKIVLKRIKPGKEETFRSWLLTLQTERHDEAVATLAAEHVKQETWFMLEIDGSWYAAAYIASDGEPLPGSDAVTINAEHHAVLKDCLEGPAISSPAVCDLQG